MLRPLVLVLVILAASTMVGPASASDAFPTEDSAPRILLPQRPELEAPDRARQDTLWIFDADFSDLTGDNAGWLTYSWNGTLASDNYWHKDTLFTDAFPHLGDSAWWCGTYDECFEQGQGYGNNWYCTLTRDFSISSSGVHVTQAELEFDQRFAMEHDYDYGYVDVSHDDGSTWTTIATYHNTGFPDMQGFPQDWDSDYGHQTLDLSYYSELDIKVRFRFQSDGALSSEDTPDNTQHSLLNGAWQIDNIAIDVYDEVMSEWHRIFFDDCESPGDNGWVHAAFPGMGQEPLFGRYQWGIDLLTHRDVTICDGPPVGEWMMAAVDPATSRTLPGMDVWLMSPPIDVTGVTSIVGQWDMWFDVPQGTGDLCNLYLGTAVGDTCEANRFHAHTDEDGIMGWYGGPFWGTFTDNWDAFAGGDWLKVGWRYWDEYGGVGDRYGGLFLSRQRVGSVIGEPEPSIRLWRAYSDWFTCQFADALGDFVQVEVEGFVPSSMRVLTWLEELGPGAGTYLDMSPVSGQPGFWELNMPPGLLTAGAEYHYYIVGVDSESPQTITYPENAPDEVLEFSILPRGGDVLLVDKRSGYAPGFDGTYQHRTAYYYESALDILGHTWDRYDCPDYTAGHSEDGPPHMALDNYETVIWFSGDNPTYVITESDADELAGWLDDASVGDTRNLILCGNDLVTSWYSDEFAYYALENYLAVSYDVDDVNASPLDICEVAGGSDFLTSPGGCSALATGCPQLPEYDVIVPSQPDAEQALEYVDDGGGYTYGAAVAHTDATDGYSVVTYGFGIEYMEAAATEDGGSGLPFLVNLLENTLGYVGTPPDTTPTGIGSAPLVNSLLAAHPNPLNPRTVIEYSVKDAGRVAIRVFNAAGKLVRTLLDEELAEGRAGHVAWDGLDDWGAACASGVYFYRIEASGFESTQKMVLLR